MFNQMKGTKTVLKMKVLIIVGIVLIVTYIIHGPRLASEAIMVLQDTEVSSQVLTMRNLSQDKLFSTLLRKAATSFSGLSIIPLPKKLDNAGIAMR